MPDVALSLFSKMSMANIACLLNGADLEPASRCQDSDLSMKYLSRRPGVEGVLETTPYYLREDT